MAVAIDKIPTSRRQLVSTPFAFADGSLYVAFEEIGNE